MKSILLAIAAVAFVACSSSSSGSAGVPLNCTTDTGPGSSSCNCGPQGTPTSTPCDAATLGDDAACYKYGAGGCECETFNCVRLANQVQFCQYGPGGDPGETQIGTCTAKHYCLSGDSCWCQDAACDSFATELSSCSDAPAKSALLKAATFSNNGTNERVDDCRAALGGSTTGTSASGSSGSASGSNAGTSGSDGSGNACNSGPGLCTNPEPSANHCRNGATCQQLGGSYGCYKSCTDDSGCAVFCFSGGGALACGGIDAGDPFRYCR